MENKTDEQNLQNVKAKSPQSHRKSYQRVAEELNKGYLNSSIHKVPFCGACLKEDYELSVNDNKVGVVKGYFFQPVLKKWEEYSGTDKFLYLGHDVYTDPKTRKITEYHHKFECKSRGHGHTIGVTVDAGEVDPYAGKNRLGDKIGDNSSKKK